MIDYFSNLEDISPENDLFDMNFNDPKPPDQK
jgi:hypothetical protein